MTFILIKGTFQLKGIDKNGNSYGYQPDGDSIRFKPQNPIHLDKLEQTGWKYELNGSGHIQLRFEAIDALETHAENSDQPHAEEAREYLLNILGFKNVEYSASGRYISSVDNDGQPGYIISRQLGPYGRPISFAYSGTTKETDGKADFWLTPDMVKQSLNAELLQAGQAYPLYYTSLYYDLRDALTELVKNARNRKKGIWKYDKSTKGFQVPDFKVLETKHVIFPKLFRRIAKFYNEGGKNISNFLNWLTGSNKNDELMVMPQCQYVNFDYLIDVKGNRVKLKANPENIVFVP